MIQQKLTKTKTKMILITKTLVVFPLFYTPARQLGPLRSHINQYIADIHTRYIMWQCHRILVSDGTVIHLLCSDAYCSIFGFCSSVASIC